MRRAWAWRIGLVVALAMQLVRAQSAQPSAADVERRVDSLLSQMTLDEKIELLGGRDNMYTKAIPRLGIPSLKMSDGPVGVRVYGPSTAYTAGIALAASWDEDLAHQVGASMGRDARARGVHIILGPGMNIYRAPMNGRNFEYFGEDPYLASRAAVGEIEGIQSQGVMATAKHFVANNMEYGRMDHSADMDERTLREIYLPAFEASVREAKVAALMDAYNLVNGVYMTQNSHINTEIAKKEWGFDGIIMSDWGATHDGIAAANGGLDLEMPSAEYMTPETLHAAIQQGTVSVATIDDKVRRILRKAIQFGFLDRDQLDDSIALYNEDSNRVALEEALEGMVLLKNDGSLLPFDKTKLKSIAVIGPDAYPAVPGGGGSSKTTPFRATSFLEGISDALVGSNTKVLYSPGSPNASTVFDATKFTTTAAGGEAGLAGEYFNNTTLEGAPALVRTDARIHFNWGHRGYRPGGPHSRYSVRWTGYYTPTASGQYTFYVGGQDGFRLYVNDQIVMDEWDWESTDLQLQSFSLEAGKPVKVRLEYFDDSGSASIGFGVAPGDTPEIEQAKKTAAKADVVVVCVGFDPTVEGEGRDRTFRLPNGQDQLIQAVASVNHNVVVVLTAGGAVDMTGWIDRVPALMDVWYPGQEGGRALAKILLGDVSPSGKLPASFERRWEDNPTYHSYYPQNGDKHVQYTEGVFLGYRYYDRAAVKPLFPFGFGLSYTKFQYSNLSVTPGASSNPDTVAVSFDIKNAGSRAGAEVAELYVGDSHSNVPRPVKELKGFARVSLQPGETQRVTLHLNRRSFSYYDVKNHGWRSEPGEFSILVGSSSAQIELQGSFQLKP
ncbi:MAG: glycoside hydrolase family 3 C-terminal domain-containing protein [Candidatus Acidiferrales bacterium]